jgi:hypothetical protein
MRNRGSRRDEPASAGLLPARRPAGGPGGGHAYEDDLWAVAGLWACAAVLAGIDQAQAATEVDRAAAALWADVEGSLAATAEVSGTAAIPSGPRRPVDVAAAAALVACAPLGLLAADDQRVTATAQALRGHTLDAGPALYDPALSGLATAATLLLATAELRAGAEEALARLGWLLDAATGTWSWATAVHPRLGGGCGGDGHDAVTAALFLSFVRDLLVHEAAGGLVLSALVPPSWLGQGWEVHDAPTAYGPVSYAVRWHGERPALLWDLEAHAGTGPVRLTIPGLDPSWSTTERRGEALLAAVAPPPSDRPASPEPPAGGSGEPGSLS